MQHGSNVSLDLNYLNEVSGGDPDFTSLMLNTFREEAKKFVRDFDTQLQRGDFSLMRQIAHRMKPTGSYIGAISLTAHIRTLEDSSEKGDYSAAKHVFEQVRKLIGNILIEIEKGIN